MSTPILLACSAAALCLGLPVLATASHLEAKHRAASVADAAALAAADAASGWIDANVEPCELAQQVASAVGASVIECNIDKAVAGARVVVRLGAPIPAESRAYAAANSSVSWSHTAPVGANGWAWPSNVRGVTQGFHNGFAIDLAVAGDGTLYAPFDGVVISAGPDGGGIPEACRAQPSWWRGQNHTVLIRHNYQGTILFSSHNHVAPGSSQRLGMTVGSRVVAGQAVAQSGMSGCTSGPHSHFTLSTQPSSVQPDVNPYLYIGSP